MNKRFKRKIKSSRYSFKLPFAEVKSTGGRVKALHNPTKKMSKSDPNPVSCINMTDSDKEIIKKIKKSVTDSESGVVYDTENRPGTANLLNIYSGISGLEMEQLEPELIGLNKCAFKENLCELLINHISPIRAEIERLNNDKAYVESVIRSGADAANEIAEVNITEIRK